MDREKEKEKEEENKRIREREKEREKAQKVKTALLFTCIYRPGDGEQMIDYIDKVMSIPSHSLSAGSGNDVATVGTNENEGNGGNSKINALKGWLAKSSNNGGTEANGASSGNHNRFLTSGKRMSKSARPAKQQQQQQQPKQKNRPRARTRKSDSAGLPVLDLREFSAFSRKVKSAPHGSAAAGAAGGGNPEAAVRRLLRRIPVTTDERMLAKYKCNHCL